MGAFCLSCLGKCRTYIAIPRNFADLLRKIRIFWTKHLQPHSRPLPKFYRIARSDSRPFGSRYPDWLSLQHHCRLVGETQYVSASGDLPKFSQDESLRWKRFYVCWTPPPPRVAILELNSPAESQSLADRASDTGEEDAGEPYLAGCAAPRDSSLSRPARCLAVRATPAAWYPSTNAHSYC